MVIGSQPAGEVSHKPGSRLPLLSTRPTVTLASLTIGVILMAFSSSMISPWLLPVSLLGEQRHDGCEQFA